MSFKSLIELGDKEIREELGDYYFISKDRMDGLVRSFKNQADCIKSLNAIIAEQQDRLKSLQDLITLDDQCDKI